MPQGFLFESLISQQEGNDLEESKLKDTVPSYIDEKQNVTKHSQLINKIAFELSYLTLLM